METFPVTFPYMASESGRIYLTIKDIARESGFAVSTVSRALNNHPDVSTETKNIISAIVNKHRFVPNNNARQLKQQSSKSISVIVKGTLNTFLSAIIEELQSLAAATAYGMQVHYIYENADEVLAAGRICREQKPLGIIFLGGNISAFKKSFAMIDIPCVLATTISEELKFDNLSCVGINDEDAACRAVGYLLENGHRKIGVLGGDTELSYISAMRCSGCKAAFKGYGEAFNMDYYQKSNYNLEGAHSAARALLARHKDITAIFCMSDIMAVGAMRAIHEAGCTVPWDISVMGFDGIELAAYLTPSLTTIRQPRTEIARNSMELLMSHIEKHTASKTISLQDSLVIGESVRQI